MSDPVNGPGHYRQGGIESLRKAAWYVARLLGTMES